VFSIVVLNVRKTVVNVDKDVGYLFITANRTLSMLFIYYSKSYTEYVIYLLQQIVYWVCYLFITANRILSRPTREEAKDNETRNRLNIKTHNQITYTKHIKVN